jgi:hypothetical protein
MTAAEIHKLYAGAPFEPFVIHLADGRSFRVPSREWMSFAPSGRTIHVYQRDDSSEVIDLLLVTSLEVPSGKAKIRRRHFGSIA